MAYTMQSQEPCEGYNRAWMYISIEMPGALGQCNTFEADILQFRLYSLKEFAQGLLTYRDIQTGPGFRPPVFGPSWHCLGWRIPHRSSLAQRSGCAGEDTPS